MKNILCLFLIFANLCEQYVIAEHEEDPSTDLYVIEGKVFPWDNTASSGWQLMTHVMANGGEHYGFLREDGTFIISNVPSGSYMVEVVNPNYVYEPVRVEINSKGKFRARKVNLIQTSQVIQVPYPLKMRPLAPFRYFQVREQWRMTDFLFNPMVLMMVLPLVLIMILPKIMNDPETRKSQTICIL
ncbi:ER membrane protein complex subunit 7-like isoform X2 [Nylanderia fulva]|uniref:ER membrane protein complex subunit 7-like isoform X2 n=1 Tax=Nylanderia fulva TaxID=613905 RepID=UPI0010FB3197|nr:ER membrane protein complex subunit 7-like isoform X2 [Nylanderia fulva]XP_029177452.1 ER membrane protein complex subunit 7-like isoform X2 [Nylanderia fulva]